MSDELSIKDCRYRCEEVGAHLRSSKLRHLWEFSFEGKVHSVELFVSKFTNKRKILVDKRVILPSQQYVVF
jgi:hypothetical protein